MLYFLQRYYKIPIFGNLMEKKYSSELKFNRKHVVWCLYVELWWMSEFTVIVSNPTNGFQVWKSSLILFLSTIDVKKQSSMGLFFFYPNISEFLCNRFRKGAQPNGMDKRDILSVGMCCLS